MYFVLSKIAWFLLAPAHILIGLILVGAVLSFTRAARLGRALVLAGGLAFALLGLLPVGDMMLGPLETRFPRYVEDGRPVAGIVVLGGGEDPRPAEQHGVLATGDAAERLIAFADLARRHPEARLVHSGGSGSVTPAPKESEMVRRHAAELGWPAERVIFEDRSRNTRENALFTKELMQPRTGERWLLVTSAWHMPRAVGIFRGAGFDVVAHPVDYRGVAKGRGIPGIMDGLRRVELAWREYVGLVASRLLGHSDELWPGPQSSRGSANR